MKYIILCLALLSININSAQDEILDLVEQGIVYHDLGSYEKAIETYKKALEIDKNSPLVNYEIALTYFYNNDCKKAIKHSDIVIDNDGDHVKESIITKGSCLEILGKTRQSINLFKKALETYDDEILIYYNLALNYYKLKDFENAEKYVTQGIAVQTEHASSHLLLGYLNFDNNKRVQSLLNLHYFLFLEPGSARSPQAAGMIQSMMSHNVTIDKDQPNTINISFSASSETGSDDDFGAAEMMLSLLEASKAIEENEGKTDDDLFIENTSSFFSMLGELQDEKKTGIYWEHYIPFFNNLAKSDHMPAYCHYVMQSTNESSNVWLTANEEAFEAFGQWLRGY